MTEVFLAAVAEVAERWRRLTPRAWAETVDGRSRADLAYELLTGWTGGRPLTRPAYPAALADMLVVLAAEHLREGGDPAAAHARLTRYAALVAGR